MKKFCKIISIFVTGWFIAMTIPANNIVENVKAEEIEVDEDFIDWVLYRLTSVASSQYWMGREYGSPGEQEASDRLEDLWNINISGGIFEYADKEQIDKDFDNDGIDEKWGIWSEDDYSLYITGNDMEDEHSCYPITDGKIHPQDTYKVKLTPEYWYGPKASEKKDIELFTIELNEELKKENILYEINGVLLNDCSGLSGEVAYFNDYSGASINDTMGKIHLIDIDQDENDDSFNEKVNNVYNSNGTGFIAMVTNPTFINTLNTSVKGMAISFYDGEKIKQSLENGETVDIEIDEESFVTDTQVTLKVYHIEQQPRLYKYIYLIDMDKYTSRQFEPRYPSGVVNLVWLWSLLDIRYPTAKAFLYKDLSETNSNTYLCYPECVQDPYKSDSRTDNPSVGVTVKIPGFCINGSKGDELKNDDLVSFKMKPENHTEVLSYNVIGEIDTPSDEVVIVCAHYDGFWAQGAMDDATGIAAAYGVAKYIKDHDITPTYDIKFIAFGGEEYYKTRGANQYVWKHVIRKEEGGGAEVPEDIYAVINLDVLGVNTKMIDNSNPPIQLMAWIHPFTNNKIFEYWYKYILNDIVKLDDYQTKTGYSYYAPNFKTAYGRYMGGDAHAFRPLTGETMPLAFWIVSLERFEFLDLHQDWLDHWEDLSFFDHRGGGKNFEDGDVISKVDYNDLYETTKMALRLTGYFAGFDVNLEFDNDCVYTQLDLDNDGQYDSVKIGYTVDSNITSGGQIESKIYLDGQPQTSNFTTGYFTIGENETVYGNLTVTLPYNGTAGNCDVRVYLENYEGDEEDFDNATIYLYPYNDSIANFTWEVNDSNLKMVNFTDCSTPSSGATINSWNWSFGDGYYSSLQNCSHNYSNVGTFNVTLNVTDSVGKSANITQEVETSNTPPVAMFNVSSTLVLVNKTVSFNSTSYDVDGSIDNATWYFGDNTSGYGINTSHSYNKSSYYMVSLFATDNDNSTAKITKTDHILVVDALVDDNFIDDPTNHSWNTIQEGINDVSYNSIIYVYNGSYQPYVVNRPASVFGESRTGVIISSNDIGINILCLNATIKNFTINGGAKGVNIWSFIIPVGNSLVENGDINDATYGVYIGTSDNNTIKGCMISNASTAGIRICAGSMNNVVDDCNISNCYYGIGVHDSSYNWVGNPSIYDWYPNDCTFRNNTYSVYVDDSDHTSILGCDISSVNNFSVIVPGRKGIYLDEASNTTISTCCISKGDPGVYFKDAMNSKVEFCKIIYNTNGVEFSGEDAKDNLITENKITLNSQYGVYIPTNDPSDNTIIYNDFKGNGNQLTNQSYDYRTTSPKNNWNKTGNNTLTKNGNGEGNYWDDYIGADLNHDGIGDTNYTIDPLRRSIPIYDNYPLMEPYGWCRDWE